MSYQLDQTAKLRKIILQAWKDPEFKRELLADPKKVLADRKINVGDYGDVKVVECVRSKVTYLVLPARPGDSDGEPGLWDCAEANLLLGI